MKTKSDISVQACDLYFLQVETRIPLKFGPEITTHATCARTRITLEDSLGNRGEGWGETPLSVAWVWPSSLSYAERDSALKEFCRLLAREFPRLATGGHPMEIGFLFMKRELPRLLSGFNASRAGAEPMPWLAALVCFSLFDIAVHDAFSSLLKAFVYDTYNSRYMNHDLAWYYGEEYKELFSGKYPEDFFVTPAPSVLPAWHLVGGKDVLTPSGPDRRRA